MYGAPARTNEHVSSKQECFLHVYMLRVSMVCACALCTCFVLPLPLLPWIHPSPQIYSTHTHTAFADAQQAEIVLCTRMVQQY